MEAAEQRRPLRVGFQSFGPELLILAGGVLFAALGRGRWANLTEDHGFWFSAAQNLLTGGRAMHEVRVQYGPVSLWILEGACRIFGTRVSTLVAFQFAVGLAAITAVQIYSHRFLNSAERWLSSGVLVTLIVWMVGPGSLLYPCAFAMSHGLILLLATLFVADAFLRRGRVLAASVAGLLAAVTFLTKQEFGVAAALGIAALTVFRPGIATGRKLASLIASGALFVAAYFGILELARHGESFRHLVEANLLWPWVPVPRPWRALYARTLGLDDPMARLIEISESLLSVLVFGGTFLLALYGRWLGRRRLAAAAVGLAAGWVLWWWRWTEGSHFRPMQLALPVIVASVGLVLWKRGSVRAGANAPAQAGLRDPEGKRMAAEGRGALAEQALGLGPERTERQLGALLSVAAGAVILLQREGYRGAIEAYYSGMGYVLAVPIAAPLLWRVLRGPKNARWQPVVAAGVAIVELASFGRGRLRTFENQWRNTVPFSAKRGTVHLTAASAPALIDTARFLERTSRDGDPILVLPNTFGLDFLLDRRNLSLFPYVSPGFLTPDGERDLIRRCEETPPKAAVIFEKSFGVLRSGDYGAGFATDLVAWLETHLPRQERFSFPDGRQGRRLLPPAARPSERARAAR